MKFFAGPAQHESFSLPYYVSGPMLLVSGFKGGYTPKFGGTLCALGPRILPLAKIPQATRCVTLPNYIGNPLEISDNNKMLEITTLIRNGTAYTRKVNEELHIYDSSSSELLAVYGVYGDSYIPFDRVTCPDTGKITWSNPKSSIQDQVRALSTGRVPYSDLLVSQILDRITQGEGLTSICLDPKMPTYPQFMRWMRINPWIKEELTLAREARAEYHRDKVKEEADMAESTKDPIEATKVRIEANKWLAGVDDARFKNNNKLEATISMPTQIIVQTGIERDVGPLESLQVSKKEDMPLEEYVADV